MSDHQKTSHKQSGFGVIAYILLAVVLLGALTAALSRGGVDVTSDAKIDEVRENLYSQAQYIESAIQDCLVRNGFAGGSAENPGYPVTGDVEDLDCPNTGTGLWTNAWFYPKDINGFDAWELVNDEDGVSISIVLSDANNDRFKEGVIGVTMRGRWGNNDGDTACDGGESDKACTCDSGTRVVYYLTRETGINHCSAY